MLRTLTLSAEPMVASSSDAATSPPPADLADRACAYCGAVSGRWQVSCPDDADDVPEPIAACPLCVLARRLDRPRIDEEAALIWLPEMSQQAINTVMREVHMQLRRLGEDLRAPVFRLATSNRRMLYHAGATLADRRGAAVSRLGTDRPADLASALLGLSPAAYARREALLGGVRLLPLGCFFVDGEDVYPKIVDTWRELARAAGPLRRGVGAGRADGAGRGNGDAEPRGA